VQSESYQKEKQDQQFQSAVAKYDAGQFAEAASLLEDL
jgi:hypothetical protein